MGWSNECLTTLQLKHANPMLSGQKQKVKISLSTERVVCLTGDDKTVRHVNDKKQQGVKSGQNSAKKETKQRQKGGKTGPKRGIIYQTAGRRCHL